MCILYTTSTYYNHTQCNFAQDKPHTHTQATYITTTHVTTTYNATTHTQTTLSQDEYKRSKQQGGPPWSSIIFVKTKLNAFAVAMFLQKLPALKDTPSAMLLGLGSDIKVLDITPEVCIMC